MFHTMKGWCALYKSCDKRRITKTAASTFERVGPLRPLKGKYVIFEMTENQKNNDNSNQSQIPKYYS